VSAAIIIFLVIPAIHSVFALPNEFRALKSMWQSADLETLDRALRDLREKDML
jgi:hypothetical protein